MREDDGRKLDHKTLEALRVRAVGQVEKGARVEDVAAALGLNRSSVFKWVAAYHAGGKKALRARPVPGRPPKLSGVQTEEIYQIVAGTNPDQHQLDFGLWTRDLVRQIIATRFGVELSLPSVGRLLHKLGMSPQRPLHRAWQSDPQAVAEWREQVYPPIAAEAKKKEAVIFFGDEASVRSDYHSGTTWGGDRTHPGRQDHRGPVQCEYDLGGLGPGQAAVLHRGRHHECHPVPGLLPSAAARRGQTGGADRRRTCRPQGQEGPQVGGLDRGPVHPGAPAGLLPVPQPRRMGMEKPITGPDQFKALAVAGLRRLQRLPQIVRGFFADPDLAYINAAA